MAAPSQSDPGPQARPGGPARPRLSRRTVVVPPLVGGLLGAVALLLRRSHERCGEDLECLGNALYTFYFVALGVPVLAVLCLVVARVPRGWLVALAGVVAGWALGLAAWLFRAGGELDATAEATASAWAVVGAGVVGAAAGVLVAGVGPWRRVVRAVTAAVVTLVLLVAFLDHRTERAPRAGSLDGDLAEAGRVGAP